MESDSSGVQWKQQKKDTRSRKFIKSTKLIKLTLHYLQIGRNTK